MVVGHKYFSCNTYTRIPRPEITMGSWVICCILWLTHNVTCNEWQVWVWLGISWIMLRNMSEVKRLPLSRREKNYQSKNIEHVEEQCFGPIHSWEYHMVIGHKYFSHNIYTRIPRPEITMGSWMIRRILWLAPNVICNEWQVWVWLGMPWIVLRNMTEVKGLPLSRREEISPATWLMRPNSMWQRPNKVISVIICLT